MNSIDIYNILTSKNVSQFENLIQTYEPTPNSNDYSIGFIFRYFTRKSNDENGVIYEISKETFDAYSNNPSYVTLRMRWKISGTNSAEVEQLNQRSINYSQETMSNIDTYVRNLTKFYRG